MVVLMISLVSKSKIAYDAHGDINDVHCCFEGVHVMSIMSKLMTLMCDVDNISFENHYVHNDLFDASIDIYDILSITSPKTFQLSLAITTISIKIIISVSQKFHGLAYPFK